MSHTHSFSLTHHSLLHSLTHSLTLSLTHSLTLWTCLSYPHPLPLSPSSLSAASTAKPSEQSPAVPRQAARENSAWTAENSLAGEPIARSWAPLCAVTSPPRPRPSPACRGKSPSPRKVRLGREHTNCLDCAGVRVEVGVACICSHCSR
jgi:hypothetical protein